MIHGFLGRPHDFRRLLPEVSKHCRVFNPELPGMVTTDLGEHAPLDQIGMAEFVEVFLEGLGLTSCHLIGHSMGAGVAVSYAAHSLERVKRLGLISPVSHKMYRALVKT